MHLRRLLPKSLGGVASNSAKEEAPVMVPQVPEDNEEPDVFGSGAGLDNDASHNEPTAAGPSNADNDPHNEPTVAGPSNADHIVVKR